MTALETATAAVRLYAESHPRPPHVTQTKKCGKLLTYFEKGIQ